MAKSFIFLFFSLFFFSAANAQKTYNEVSLPELLKKLEQKEPNMIIVDVRSKAEYYDTVQLTSNSTLAALRVRSIYL